MRNPFNFEPVPLKNVANCGCPSRELDRATAEFELEEEFRGGRRFPIRSIGPRPRSLRAPLRTMKKPFRPPLGRPKRPGIRSPYRGRWLSGAVIEDPSLYREPFGAEPEPSTGTEHTRWVQDCLNQALGLQLPVTGVMGPETRSAIRSFQRQQGLRTSGIVGPDTQYALQAACAGARGASASEQEGPWQALAGQDRNGLDEEYRIVSSCTIDAKRTETRSLTQERDWRTLPKAPGVYVIRSGVKTIYVGKTGEFKTRFNSRRLALRHLGIPLSSLAHLNVDFYSLKGEGRCLYGKKTTRQSVWNDDKPLDQVGIIHIAEAGFIDALKPTANELSNYEKVHIGQYAKLSIRKDGKPLLFVGPGVTLPR